jgi:tRNA (guanine26-N2/guanine27-N2)-dimethyltransferase
VIAGPIWSAPIHDINFVSSVRASVSSDATRFLSTRQRIEGVLSVVCEELHDQPLYYVGDALCGVLHCTSPGFLPLRSALLHAGYQVSLSHANKCSFKTNASASVIWDIMRCWVRSHPVKEARLQDSMAAKTILSKQPSFEADFSLHPEANPKSRAQGLVRWQINPERNWGPKARAARSGNVESLDDRRLKGTKKAIEERVKRKAGIDLKKFPCKKHREGVCDLGGDCRYSHMGDGDAEEQLHESTDEQLTGHESSNINTLN